jgi:putative membrane protein
MSSLSPRPAVAAAILAGLLSASVSAQTPGYSTTAPAASPAKPKATGAAQLSDTDRKFVEQAAIDGLAEVQFGKLAQKKGANDAVKKFAARMVQDHGKANQQLKQLASAKGVQLPTDLDDRHKEDMQRLEKLSGAEFGALSRGARQRCGGAVLPR